VIVNSEMIRNIFTTDIKESLEVKTYKLRC